MSLNYQLSWRELAHHLVDDLLSDPGISLAGVDALGKQHKASRLTVKRALSHLEELGILAPAERGKKRQVNLNKLYKIAALQNPEKSKNRVVFLAECPESNPAYMTRSLYEEFHKLCDQQALFLTYIQVPSDPSGLRALLNVLQPRGAILYSTPGAISEVVYSLSIPAINFGGQDTRLIPHFYSPYGPLLIHAFEQAVATGHHRITVPMVHAKAPYYEGLATELEKHFSTAPISFSRRYTFPLVQGPSVKEYHDTLQEIFRYTPPTCMILHDLPEYLSASSFFMKKGLRIPDDISVIHLSNDPAFDNIDPSIAHFLLFSEAEARSSFSVLMEQMNGFLSHEQKIIKPIWVPGGSLAPPKSR